jgi:uncharacterized protein YrrD
MPLFPHELHAGADVFSSDGHKLGQLHRAVLKRSDLGLTHVVIDIGFLRSGHKLWEGGLGLDYDRVVPADAVRSATAERVELALTAAQFRDAPEYSEERYDPPHDLTPGEFDIPDVVGEAQRWAAALGSTPDFWLAERLNKGLDEVDIAEGTPVWRREPHEKLGEVHRLLFEEGSGRLAALVIKRGFIFHHETVLPVRYFAELLDDIVRVEISDVELHQLREYREAERG